MKASTCSKMASSLMGRMNRCGQSALISPINRQYASFSRHSSALSSKLTSRSSTQTAAAAAGFIGILGASGYLYTNTQSRWVHAESQEAAEQDAYKTKKAGYAPEPTSEMNYLPNHPDSEKLLSVLANAKSIDDLDLTLFQYQVCPFCCKVRAFLDKNKIPYKMVEVHPISKTEVKWSKEYTKVPILVVNGVQLNDSSVIITALNRFLTSLEGQQLTDSNVDRNELHWRQWVDDRFVRVIPPNIYRTYDEARSSFEYITDRGEFSYWQQKVALYAGALAMWGVSKKLAKKYNIVDERATLYDCANEWCSAIPQGKPFMGGNQPNLADLAVYGVLSSVEGLRAFNDMCEHTDIGQFYYRMKETVGESSSMKKSLEEVQPVIDNIVAKQEQTA